jgi:hypothetical protein
LFLLEFVTQVKISSGVCFRPNKRLKQAFLSTSLSSDINLILSARVGVFLVMNGGASKAWTRGSRVKLSKALQVPPPDAVASNAAGMHVDVSRELEGLLTHHSLCIELLPSYREQSPESGDLAGDATPVQARKRRLHATTKSDPVPAKRARLTRTDTQQPRVEDEKSEQAGKV